MSDLASRLGALPPIIESDLLVVDGEPYEKRRTWRERLLSRPWRPFKPTRTVVPKLPDRNFYMANDPIRGQVIYAHPQLADELRRKVAEPPEDAEG